MYLLKKIGLSANIDKRIQSITSIETCACGKSKYLVYIQKEEIKCNNIIKQHKNVYYITKENIKKHNQLSCKFFIMRTKYQ